MDSSFPEVIRNNLPQIVAYVKANITHEEEDKRRERCVKYSSFMQDLSRGHAEAVYWCLLVLLLLCLCTSAWTFTNTESAYKYVGP